MSGRTPAVRTVVANIDELPEGERLIVRVARREIGIFNVGGEFFALRNVCPHRGAPVCDGRLRPRIEEGTALDFAFSDEGEILKCPWHQWEFDIKTGDALDSPGMSIRTFRVEREGDEVVLYL